LIQKQYGDGRKCIFEVVMVNGHFDHHPRGPNYMNKWGCMDGDFKKIHNHLSVIRHNENY
jgi:hypothetical protein